MFFFQTMDRQSKEQQEDTNRASSGGDSSQRQVALPQVALRSSAVVKYANEDMPGWFQRLLPNTNLNKPPSNWLNGNSRWETYIRQSTSQGRPRDDPFSR